MDKVIAICPLCNQKISVDMTQPASICPSCSQAIITEKAIEAYMLATFSHLLPNVAAPTPVANTATPAINPKIYQIEDGELTKYKGNKADLTLPDGIVSIGGGALYHVNKVTLSSTVKKIRYPQSYVGHVVFFDGVALDEIEDGALCDCKILENILLDGISAEKFRKKFKPSSLLIKASKADFLAEHPDYTELVNEYDEKGGSQYFFFFDFVKTVKTEDGWLVAIGKDESVVLKSAQKWGVANTILADEYEGKPLTHVLDTSNFRPQGEKALPKHLVTMPRLPKGVYIVPLSIKAIGSGMMNYCSLRFEKVDGLPTTSLEYLSVDNASCKFLDEYVVSPNLKTTFAETKFLPRDEVLRLIEADRKFESELYEVTFEAKDDCYYSVTVQSRGKVKKEMFERNSPVTIKVHPSDVIKVKNRASSYDDTIFPHGMKKFIVSTPLFSPTLKFKAIPRETNIVSK